MTDRPGELTIWRVGGTDSTGFRVLASGTVLGASEVSANLYCNSRTSVLGRLRDYLRLLMGRRYLSIILLVPNRLASLTCQYLLHSFVLNSPCKPSPIT